jgi:hypothetical protein
MDITSYIQPQNMDITSYIQPQNMHITSYILPQNMHITSYIQPQNMDITSYIQPQNMDITSYILPQNMDITSYILPQNMDEMTMVHFTDYKAHFENLFTILCKCPVLSVVQLLSLTKNLFYLHNFQHLLAMQDSLGYNRSYI